MKKWLIGRKASKKNLDTRFMEKQTLLQEIRRAHADWEVAQLKLSWVMEKDQIDYAIYALEAAEKRYEMLIRQAKLFSWEDGERVAAAAMEPVPAEQ